MRSLKVYIFHPSLLIQYLFVSFFRWLPSKVYLRILFRLKLGYPLNFKNPQTFNEKLQWLKLYNRKPEYTLMVDKYEVKKYVASIIGSEYIIPTIGVWDRPEDIDWDSLPNQFVLKTTHGGGGTGVVICKDKASFNMELAVSKLNHSLRHDISRNMCEWPYKNIKRKVIAEQYFEDAKTKELRDYKFFCFNGKCECMFVATARMQRSEPFFDFYDREFNHLDIVQGHPNSPIPIERPVSFELMIRLAEKLSVGIPHVRVDFYEVDGKPYFGELTFFHFSGLVPFEPKSWDLRLGEMIDIN